MPHSTSASAASISTYPLDTPHPKHSSHLSTQGTPQSFSKASSQQPAEAERSGLPGPDVPAELIGKAGTEDPQPTRFVDASTMLTNYNNSSKQRTRFYQERLQYKAHANGSVRERVSRHSPVVAELRTNVIIKDEFTFVTDLSYHLAARYTRPDSAIMIKLDHTSCLALGGTFDPCYILTITAVSSQMGPTMNKRNAALIQSFMADILYVPPERGIVKFSPVPEENLAINGTTMLGEIQRQEKQQSNDNSSSVRHVISNGRKGIPSLKKNMHKPDLEPQATEKEEEEPEEARSKTGDLKKAESGRTETKGTDVVTNDPNEWKRGTTSTPVPSTILSAPGIFELPVGDSEKKPISHSHTVSNGSNGLRMNGISDPTIDLARSNPRALNGRSQMFSAGSTKVEDKDLCKETSGAAHIPPIQQSPVPLSRRELSPSFLKQDSSSSMPQSASNASVPTKHSSQSPPEDKPRPRENYINGLMGTTTALKDLARTLLDKPAAIFERVDSQYLDKEQEKELPDDKSEPTANSARRRSTIVTVTAPKWETSPVPEKHDVRSTKSLKMGMRKSFFSAFRRSPAATSN